MLLLVLLLLLIFLFLIERELDRQDEPFAPTVENCCKCETEITSDLLICPGCSHLLREHCPACGESKAVNHRYCTLCGQTSVSGGHYAA